MAPETTAQPAGFCFLDRTTECVRVDDQHETVRNALALLAAVYVLTLAAMLLVGVTPTVPVAFLPFCLLVVVPLAYAVTVGLTHLETILGHRPGLLPMVGVVLGVALIAVNGLAAHWWQLSLMMLLACGWSLVHKRRDWLAPLALSLLCVFCLYGAVWNLNHLVAIDGLMHLRDSQALQWDLELYQLLAGRPMESTAMFPLIKSAAIFWILENAYLLLFCEVFVVIFLHTQQRANLQRFLACTFAAYLIAVVVFYVYPIVGPFTQPDTLHTDYHDTKTFELMTMLNEAYAQIRAGRPTNGFGYVVGMPSLHVAMAIILSRFLVTSRMLFWTFVPVNVLMALATFMLGYHYFVDSATGVVLAVGVLMVDRFLERGRVAQELARPNHSSETFRNDSLPNFSSVHL